MPEPAGDPEGSAPPAGLPEPSLAIFGPPALYGWVSRRLLVRDPGSLGLSMETMRLLRQAIRHLPEGEEEKRPHSILSLEYATLLNCLSDDDFGYFVDEVLKQAGLSYQLHNSQLRQTLLLLFGDAFYLPSDGPLRSLRAAKAQAEEAGRALGLCAKTVEPVRRYEAVVQLHSAVDRTLIYAERFLDLILEFLAQLCEKYRVGDDKLLECPRSCLGPRNDAEPAPRRRKCEWHVKHQSQGELARALLDELFWPDAPTILRTFLQEWEADLEASRASRGAGIDWDTKLDCLTSSEIMDRLRQIRNDLRHPPVGLSTCQEPPEPYTSKVVPLQRLLGALEARDVSRRIMPVMVRILRVSRDRLGFWRVLMAVEDGEQAEAVFTDQGQFLQRTSEAVQKFMDKDIGDDLLVDLARQDHFLFPRPDETRIVVNPLIVQRLVPPQAVPDLMQFVLEAPPSPVEPDSGVSADGQVG